MKKALEEWTPVGRIALLVDEIETHLHPRSQHTRFNVKIAIKPQGRQRRTNLGYQ